MKSTALVVAAAMLALACQARPVMVTVEPIPPASSEELDLEARCDAAGKNLRSPAVNCPEGYGSIGGESFIEVCARAYELRSLPLECWATAKDATAARACGSLRCLR